MIWNRPTGWHRPATPSFLWLLVSLLLACGQPVDVDDATIPPREDHDPSTVAVAGGTQTQAIDTAALATASLLVITLDTTRADHLQPYAGSDGAATPHLQTLADQGVVFERAWATAPVTLPTHASLWTGLNPPSHGVRNNGIHYLSPEHETLAEVLGRHGFRTAAFVSAAVLDHRYGLDQGFDHYDDDMSSGGPKQLRLNAERPAHLTVAAAGQWLDQRATDERFFLWVHLFDPHAPYDPPPPWKDRYSDRPYAGEIAATDAAIGSLLQHPRLADRRSSLVVVVGDHGESLGEHGESTHGMLAYDATLRIPWLMRLPVGGEGRRVTQSVGQIDLLPTVLELLLPGGDASVRGLIEGVEGHSLRRSLVEEDPELTTRSLYAETLVPFYTYGWSPLRSVRRRGMKVIEAPQPELYDLDRDPGELHNLAVESAGDALELLGDVARFETEVPEHRGARGLDSEMTAKLRSLGYLGTRVAPPREERLDPKSVIDLHDLLEEAQHLFLAQEVEPAVERLRTVLRRDEDNLVALATLAKALVVLDQPDKAREVAVRAVGLDPTNPELLTTSGLIELSQGLLDPALQAFDAALTVDPRWLDASIERIRVLFRLQRRDEATVALGALLADDPNHARGLVAQAEWIFLPAGELERARKQLYRVTEEQPSLAEAWRILGRVLEAEGRPVDAIDVYRKGLGEIPRDGALQARLGVLMARQGSFDEAEPHLRQAVLLGQDSAMVQYAFATLARHRRDWLATEAAARRAIEISPDLSSAWNLLAASLEEQKRPQDALDAYDQARSRDPSNWQAAFNQGLLMTRLQRFSEARDLFEVVLTHQPQHSRAHFQLGALYGGVLGDDERSRHHLEASLAQVDPKSALAGEIRRLLAQLN